jgi:broad specificity phosphatase PhoE
MSEPKLGASSVTLARHIMQRLLLSAFALVIGATPVIAQGAQGTTVVLVRHAEKAAMPADDPPLTAAGEARARDLWMAIRDAGVSSVITTQFARARATAQPTASALGLTPRVVLATNPTHVQDVVTEIRKHPGKTVLVVGHSNTVPAIVEALGAKRPGAICDSRYDDIFVVTVAVDGKAGVLHSKYGEASPRDTTCAAMR